MTAVGRHGLKGVGAGPSIPSHKSHRHVARLRETPCPHRFYRVRHDKSGWEPRRLFTVVEFMMHMHLVVCAM